MAEDVIALRVNLDHHFHVSMYMPDIDVGYYKLAIFDWIIVCVWLFNHQFNPSTQVADEVTVLQISLADFLCPSQSSSNLHRDELKRTNKKKKPSPEKEKKKSANKQKQLDD